MFCLGSGAAPPERVTTLFGLIARELSKFDMSLQNQRISFARVDDQEEEVRVRFVEFIGTLVTTITPAPVGKFNKTREGPTLLMGETGTGKTAMAKRMHSILGKERPFIHINIAAINPELLESRLRGYKKGAFTGASMDQRGWFEDANGGVLFLDEFQSAPEATQLQMLDLMSAVSDTVEVARVGEDGDRKKSCRVRLVLAINKSLDAMRNEGLLRPDLFHRIRNVIELEPLSRRIQKSPALLHALLAIYRWKSNLPLRLAESQEGTDEFPHLKSMFPILSDEILNELGSYSWPGNIREFEKVCYDLYEECDELCVASPSMDVFSDAIRFGNGARGGNARKDLGESLDEGTRFRLTYVQQTLKKHKFVVKPALKELGSQSLGSRPALKHFLREHRSQLADWFVTDSRIATLLGD